VRILWRAGWAEREVSEESASAKFLMRKYWAWAVLLTAGTEQSAIVLAARGGEKKQNEGEGRGEGKEERKKRKDARHPPNVAQNRVPRLLLDVPLVQRRRDEVSGAVSKRLDEELGRFEVGGGGD
jgi:hypothetical protein